MHAANHRRASGDEKRFGWKQCGQGKCARRHFLAADAVAGAGHHRLRPYFKCHLATATTASDTVFVIAHEYLGSVRPARVQRGGKFLGCRACRPSGDVGRKRQPGLLVFDPDMSHRAQRGAIFERACAQHPETRGGGCGVVEACVASRAQIMMRNVALVFIGVFQSRPLQDKSLTGQQSMQRETAATPGLAVLAMAGIDRRLNVAVCAVGYGAATAASSKLHGQILLFQQ